VGTRRYRAGNRLGRVVGHRQDDDLTGHDGRLDVNDADRDAEGLDRVAILLRAGCTDDDGIAPFGERAGKGLSDVAGADDGKGHGVLVGVVVRL
jgi:hypothetical protein